MADQQKVATFGLDEFVGGGAVPDGKYKIKESRVVEWDYNKPENNVRTCALRLTLTPLPSGEDIQQYYSIGDAAQFQPSSDGKQVVLVGSRSGLGKSSNFHFFLSELVSAGFPEDRLKGLSDVSVFEGLEGQIVNKPQPKRAGLNQAAALDASGKEYDRTLAVFTNIDKMPWESKKPTTGKAAPAASKANGAPATAAEPAAENQDDPETTAAELLAENVTEKISVSKLRIKVLGALQKRKVDPGFKNQVVDFLKPENIGAVAEMAGLSYDQKTNEVMP